MAEKQPTPEEQLLKLIESASDSPKESGTPEKPSASNEASAARSGKGVVKVAPSMPKVVSFFSYLKDGFQKSRPIGTVSADFSFPINVKWLNRVLVAMVLAGTVYLISDFTFYQSPKNRVLQSVSTADALHPEEGAWKAQPRELSYYKDAVGRRNPFLPPGSELSVQAEQGASPQGTPAPAQNKITEILAQWKLVGISWGAEPLAMVEDTQTGRTYFLKNGQQVGEIKVQSITKQKMIISYQGEEGELY